MNLFVIFACEKGFVSFHLLQRISRLFYDTMKKLNFHIHGSCWLMSAIGDDVFRADNYHWARDFCE